MPSSDNHDPPVYPRVLPFDQPTGAVEFSVTQDNHFTTIRNEFSYRLKQFDMQGFTQMAFGLFNHLPAQRQ